MARRVALLMGIWVIASLAAIVIAWLAVSHAVANVADPVPAMIAAGGHGGVAAAPGLSGISPTTAATDIARSAEAGLVASPARPSTTTLPSSDATAAASTGIGEPISVDQPGDSTAQTPSANSASFNREGGVVTMSCQGAAASLVSATPKQGYTVTVSNSGPETIEVKFTSPSMDSEFHGHCVDGQPSAEVSDD